MSREKGYVVIQDEWPRLAAESTKRVSSDVLPSQQNLCDVAPPMPTRDVEAGSIVEVGISPAEAHAGGSRTEDFAAEERSA